MNDLSWIILGVAGVVAVLFFLSKIYELYVLMSGD